MTDMNEEEKKKILGEAADLSKGNMHSVDPNISRLKEEKLDGMIVCGYCSNCGSYPEYGEQGLRDLADIGNFEVPPKEKIKNYYVSLNTCPICRKVIEPVIELKKFA